MESLKRFYEPEDIHDPVLILVVGTLGLVVNLLGTKRMLNNRQLVTKVNSNN